MGRGPIVERYQGSLPAGVYSGIPGDPNLGGAVVGVDETGGLSLNLIDNSYLQPKLSLGNRSNPNGPIVGFGIAADSPISAVDLWLGDATIRNRARVAVGRPWFGDTSAIDDVSITLPRGVPRPVDFLAALPEAAAEGSYTAFNAQNFFWDMTPIINAAGIVANTPGSLEQAFPVRLELYRGAGEFPVPVRRAPIYADLAFRMKTTTYQRLWIITDGRSIVDVNVITTKPLGATFPLVAPSVIVRTHDPVVSTSSTDVASRGDRYHVAKILDNQTLAAFTAVIPISQFPSYKQSFVVPAQMYSVTIVNNSPGAGTTNGISGAISIVARDA